MSVMKQLVLGVLASIFSGTSLAQPLASAASERALVAYMEVQDGTETEFLAAAQAVITASRAEPGNLAYQLHQSVTNPRLFVFYELYASGADLQAHRQSPHVTAFLERTKPITLTLKLEEYAPIGTTKK